LGIFRFLYKLYFGLVYTLTGLTLWPYFFLALRGPKKFQRAKKVKKVWAKSICTLAFIRVELRDPHNFPKNGPYIVCANHASYLDIILMFLIIPGDFAFMGKAEVLKWPLINIFFKRGIDIPVHRHNRKLASESIHAAKNALESGRCLAIFPEGKMVDNPPKMARFKNGAFTLAIEHQAAIVPITFINNYQLFSDHTDLFGPGRPGKAIIKIHPPVQVDNRSELLSLRNQTFDAISSSLALKQVHTDEN
jgi:1-acyl-sn-glycerol-3-phosphate acyltransferase